MIDTFRSAYHNSIRALNSIKAPPEYQLFLNLDSGIPLKNELEYRYKTQNGSLDIDKFIQHLEGFVHNENFRPRGWLGTFDFHCISQLSIPREKEIVIYKLALKVISSRYIVFAPPVVHTDPVIDSLFSPNLLPLSIETLHKLGQLTGETRHGIFGILSIINLADRTDNTIRLIMNLYTDLKKNPAELTSAMIKLPSHDLLDAIRRIQPFLNDHKNGAHRAYFVPSIAYIPEIERDDALNSVSSLLQGLTTILDLSYAINTIQKTAKNARADIILHTLKYLDGSEVLLPGEGEICSLDITRCQVMRALKDTTFKDRSRIVEKSIPIIKHVKDAMIRYRFITIVKLLPDSDRRKEVLKDTLSLLSDVKDIQDYDEGSIIEEFISFISEEKRAEAIQKGLNHGLLINISRIRGATIYSISQGVFLEHGFSLLLSQETHQRLQLCQLFLPKEKHWSWFSSRLCSDIRENNSLKNHLRLFSFLIPQKEHRTPQNIYMIGRLAPSWGDNPNHRTVFGDFKTSLLLMLISPDMWKDAINYAPHSDEGNNHSIRTLFSIPHIRDASYQHIQEVLLSNSSPEFKFFFIDTLFGKRTPLMLHEQHPVLQLALIAKSLCDPEARSNSKNPYRIYTEIRNALSAEKSIELPLEKEEVAGQVVCWNFSRLRQKGEWQGYTRKDLHRGIGANTLDILFNRLEQRLNALSQKKQEETKSYIQSIFVTSFEKLKENALDKPFLKGLLSISGKPEDEISPSQFHLYAVLRFILDTDGSIKSSAMLSPREEQLLKISASVQNCSTGQRDGLANFYNALPQKYKTGPKAEEGPLVLAESFVDGCVQKAMNDVFASESFLSQIIEKKIVRQASHATEYLKNRFHKQVGLQHQLVIDMYTGVLEDTLLERKPEEVLTRFFQHFKPSKVVRQIIMESHEAFKDNLYTGIETLIKRTAGEFSNEETYKKYIIFDDDLNPQRLTDTGALALLLSTGYLKNHRHIMQD